MKTESVLLKIFYTGLLLAVGSGIETYMINLINTQDDIISGAGLILSLCVVLLMIYGIKKIWLLNKPQKQKEDEKSN